MRIYLSTVRASFSLAIALLLAFGMAYAQNGEGSGGLGVGGVGSVLLSGASLELLLSGCGVCGVLDYPESLMFAVRDDTTEEFKIILVYKEIAEGFESRTPVENAAIIVHVKDTGELYRVYTDENGEARYSYEPYTDDCYDFDFIYCHAPQLG